MSESIAFYDGKGNIISEFDVLKVFHFIGARRKRHYMYKWIRRNANGELCMQHLISDIDALVPLFAVCNTSGGRYIWPDAEIVQSSRRIEST